jgi:serine/threonine protein kinase
MEEPSAGDGSAREVSWADGERRFSRVLRPAADGSRSECLAVRPASEHPTPGSVSRLAHEYALKEYIDGTYACRPLEIVSERGQTYLLLEYHGGTPLTHLIARPMEIGRFLRFAVALTCALVHVHARGLVHKDIKPANILVDEATDRVWLVGFGIASRLPRERQAPEAPGLIAGTLSHMSPEQTGRMNRSIDSRSDLYSVGSRCIRR